MELLLRGAASATTRALPQTRVLVAAVPSASYRTKRNQAKRAAERGEDPSAILNGKKGRRGNGNSARKWSTRRSRGDRGDRDNRNERDDREWDVRGGRGRDAQQMRSGNRRPGREGRTTAPAHQQEPHQQPSMAEIEDEWTQLRSRSLIVPPPVLPARTRHEIANTRRMRRLGLMPEEDDDEDAFAAADPRNDGYVNHRRKQEREAPAQPLHFRNARSPRPTGKYESLENGDGGPRRIPARRPVSQKDKQFTGVQAAPENVVEREFLIPDEPERPLGLDLAVIGRPNAGKSSIMNNLLNATVSAVSAKYNTTRDRVLGILTHQDAQLTFYDTPGLIKPKESHEFVQSLVTTAAETVEGVDMSVLVVDAVKRLDDAALQSLEKVLTTSAQVSSPTMLVMNKCDLVGRREEHNLECKIKDLSQMIEEIYGAHFNAEGASVAVDPLAYVGENCMKVSAVKGTGMKHLRKTLLSLAVERPWSYHSSMRSDQSDLDLVTEIIREKLFRRFNKELPYTFEQENSGWTKFKDKSLRIDQEIFVPAARIRKMVVGRNGDTIRSVGIAAREEIEALLKRPVHLYLNVRVR